MWYHANSLTVNLCWNKAYNNATTYSSYANITNIKFWNYLSLWMRIVHQETQAYYDSEFTLFTELHWKTQLTSHYYFFLLFYAFILSSCSTAAASSSYFGHQSNRIISFPGNSFPALAPSSKLCQLVRETRINYRGLPRRACFSINSRGSDRCAASLHLHRQRKSFSFDSLARTWPSAGARQSISQHGSWQIEFCVSIKVIRLAGIFRSVSSALLSLFALATSTVKSHSSASRDCSLRVKKKKKKSGRHDQNLRFTRAHCYCPLVTCVCKRFEMKYI